MSATAIVTIKVRVYLSQPWSDEATVGEVIEQASRDGKNRVAQVIAQASNVEMAGEPTVKVIYEERD